MNEYMVISFCMGSITVSVFCMWQTMKAIQRSVGIIEDIAHEMVQREWKP